MRNRALPTVTNTVTLIGTPTMTLLLSVGDFQNMTFVNLFSQGDQRPITLKGRKAKHFNYNIEFCN